MGAILAVPVSTALKFLPTWTNGRFRDSPFLDRMTITFFVIALFMINISLAKSKPENEPHTIEVDKSMFKVSTPFVIGSVIICGLLAALYTVFW